MKTSEFKTIARLLKEAYKELEQKALDEGFDMMSERYQELQTKIRDAILKKHGFTLDEYRDAKELTTSFSPSETLIVEEIKEVERIAKEAKDTAENLIIPTEEDIISIATKVAEQVARQHIKPPQITNQIVERVEIPKVIKETVKVTERVEYDDSSLKGELQNLSKQVKDIPQLDVEALKEEFMKPVQSLKESIEIDWGGKMPDFRKLAMGLQSEMAELRANGGGGGTWGSITGTLSAQTDLQTALDAKVDTTDIITGEFGGTGVANTGKTITLGGNLTTSGAFTTTFTVTANTNVTLPDSGTLYGTKTASFNSSQLATSCSDETGTGALVFATSPFLTTPIIVTSARIPLIHGGSGTGSSLTLTSTSGVGATDFIRFNVGNNGGTEAARFLNSGYFGINTTTPEERLDVVGNFKVRDAATETKAYRFRTNGGALDLEFGGANLYISGWSGADFTGSQYQIMEFQSGGGSTLFKRGVIFNNDASSDQDFQIKGDTDDNTVFVDVSTNRTGFGTAAPDEKVHVVGKIKTTGGVLQRVVTTTDDATAAIDVDVTDVYELSAVANNTTFTLTGTPTDGQKLIVRYKDAGVSKTLTWTVFTAIGVTLPTATTASKWGYVGCVYNSAASAWHAIAVTTEA